MSAARVRRLRHGLDVVRELPAPVPRVFRALAEPDELMLWWGPPDCPMVWCSVDFRPGGVWHYRLRSRGTGEEVWARAVYGEIEPPTRLTYLETSSDASGSVTHDRPHADVAVDLAPASDAITRLTLRIRHRSAIDRDRAIRLGIETGLSRALDTLEDVLRRTTTRQETP
jgi:uncharacterized protein YndB with AHSA1/START domain